MLIPLFSGDYRCENEADVMRPARRPLLLLLLLLLLGIINFNRSHRPETLLGILNVAWTMVYGILAV